MTATSVGLKILWADDQPEFVQSMMPTVAGIAETIICVTDGTEALRVLNDQTFDVVLADLQMPPGRWGGLEMLRAMGILVREVPVIVLSGAGTLRECAQAVRLGARDYVQKEDATTELVSVVRRVLNDSDRERPLQAYGTARRIEQRLHAFVISEARRVAEGRGDPDIFISVIPREIATKTYDRMLDAKGKVPQEQMLDILDLAKIVSTLWSEVEPFRRLEKITTVRSKDDRTRWLSEFNEVRKVLAHPLRGDPTPEQREVLRRTWTIVDAWLPS